MTDYAQDFVPSRQLCTLRQCEPLSHNTRISKWNQLVSQRAYVFMRKYSICNHGFSNDCQWIVVTNHLRIVCFFTCSYVAWSWLWLGRRGSLEWPARSPDLTPYDFFLWDWAKEEVYRSQLQTLDELEDRIRDVFTSISPDFLLKSVDAIPQWFQTLMERAGSHIEFWVNDFIVPNYLFWIKHSNGVSFFLKTNKYLL